MKKITIFGPAICLILNIVLVASIKVFNLPLRTAITIVASIAVVGLAMAFVESEGLKSFSLKKRLIILLNSMTILFIGILYFLSNLSG